MTAATKHRPRTAPRPGRSPRKPPARTGPPPRSAGYRPARAGAARSALARRRRARRRAGLIWAAALAIVAGLVTAMMLVTRSGSLQASVARPAPGFTLTSTSGARVSLASFRGRDVVLYFNEGVGCGACFYQMRELENHSAQLARAGITIIPIVMNPASQVRQEMAGYGIRTPYLIDATGAVSRAYGVLGKGMHGGLPGHGFVLVDARGTERWYGEYPAMYLSTAGLIAQVRAHLHG